jgi:hypothetical protein
MKTLAHMTWICLFPARVPLTAFLLLLALSGTRLAAEGFEGFVQLPIREEYKDRAKSKETHRKLEPAFQDKGAFEQNRTAIQAYYDGFFFPALTRQEYADKLPELRQELLQDMASAKSPAREFLLGIAWKNCTLLLKGSKFHPVAQVNATLILGEMNAREATGNERGPVPYPKSLLPLIALASPSKKYAEPVQVAALLGVLRHATYRNPLTKSSPGELTDADRQAISKLVSEILDVKALPPTRTETAHAWIQSRAIQALGAIRYPGASNENAKRLIEILGDDERDKQVRVAAIEALGGMGLSEQDIEGKKVARVVGRLMYDLAAEEIERVKVEQMSGGGYTPAGPGVGGPPGGRDGGTEAPKQPKDVLTFPQTERTRRRILVWADSFRRGLVGDPATKTTGIAPALPAADAKLLVSAVDTVIKICRDKESDFASLGLEMLKISTDFDKRFPLLESEEVETEDDGESVADEGAEGEDAAKG